MKAKLLKQIRYHYSINYSNDAGGWRFDPKRKYELFSVNWVNGRCLHDCIMNAIDQIYGFTFAEKIEKSNKLKKI